MWEALRGRRIFITGGTGFFGCWLLESFAWANDKLDLNSTAVVLTRNPASFQIKAPHLASHRAIQFHRGDVRDFAFPEGEFSHIVHAATEADLQVMAGDPLQVFDVNVEGTRRVLEFARRSGVQRFLFTSSGAVYGCQPADLDRIPEDFNGGPNPIDIQSAYGIPGEAKRAAESLCALYALQFGLETMIARCFAFIGPHLPLDGKFAVGNFIRDALRGGPIQVKGDGTPYRSYLYAADLAIWLWTILFRGQTTRPYNVGSEAGLTIAGVAQAVRNGFTPPPAIQIAHAPNPPSPPSRYVPTTHRVRTELGLRETVDLSEGIRRTLTWYKPCPCH